MIGINHRHFFSLQIRTKHLFSFVFAYDWENHKQTIKSNRDFWIPKIERNRQRDREINHYYQSKGWTVLRFWDFEVKQELGSCVKRVVDVLSG